MNIKYRDQYRSLGIKIGYYRRLRGFTQEQLAEKIGKETAYLGSVEAPNIERAISLDMLFDIADALEIPAYKFLIDDDE